MNTSIPAALPAPFPTYNQLIEVFSQADLLHACDEELTRLAAEASHCCPNCDGPITNWEHEAFGVCSSCC